MPAWGQTQGSPLFPNFANTPWDIPVGRRTSALLQPPHGHLQVLGPAQVLPEEIVPAADLLGGRREAVDAGAGTQPPFNSAWLPVAPEGSHCRSSAMPRHARTQRHSLESFG